MYSKMPMFNIVRDWEMAQGVHAAQDLTYQIIRDPNIRPISIQNSATRSVGVSIVGYLDGPTPPIKFFLGAGEIRHIGVNPYGSYPQFIWLYDAESRGVISKPAIIRNDANQFVIRDGLNMWWIQPFRTGTYSAQK